MEQTAPETIDLRDYLGVILRQWRLVVGITIVLTLTALGVSFLQTPVYEATAELAVEPIRSGSDAALEDLLLRDEIIETERRVLTSRNITDRVIEEMGLTVSSRELLSMVNVRAVPNTRVLTISATDTDPQFAAAVANSFAVSYLDYRRDRALDEVTAARSNLDQRITDARDQIDAIDDELGADSGTALGGLRPDDEGLTSQRDALAQQLAQLQIQMAALDPGSEAIRGGGDILLPAEPEDSPVSPRPLRTGVLALVLGLMLGVGAAFLRDHFDDVIRTEDDVKRAADGSPIVGRLTVWDDPAADQKLITLVDPFAANSEEFQALAANVRFALLSRSGRHNQSADGPSGRSIAITSSSPGEGKTSVAGNLAVAAASTGRRVILVGADLRKPTLARRFGLPDGTGLTDVLVNASDLTDKDKLAVHLIDVGIPRLRLLPAGSIPPNPTEILASAQMAWLHNSLAEMADLIIYDTPPVLPVADTLELVQHADLVFVVTRAEQCHRRELQHALERLDAVGADIGGVIVNGMTGGRSGYGYGYGYGYGAYRRDGDGEYRPRPVESAPTPTASGDKSSVTVRDTPPAKDPTPPTTTRTPAQPSTPATPPAPPSSTSTPATSKTAEPDASWEQKELESKTDTTPPIGPKLTDLELEGDDLDAYLFRNR